MFFNGRWGGCCVKHDLRYWYGGTKKDQFIADKNLKICVKKKSNRFISYSMYYGVRFGHYSPFKLSSHWGWGLGASEKFRVLTTSELAQIKEEVQKLPLEKELIEEFIQEYDL